jgi:hypothetical protein
MPEPDSTSIGQAKKRASELAMQRAGRASTILTGGGSLGDYSGTKLGGN